jgi:hypothetical protein
MKDHMTNTEKDQFVAELREWSKTNSLYALARLADVSYTTVFDIPRNSRRPHATTISKLRSAMGQVEALRTEWENIEGESPSTIVPPRTHP